jgi:hypothetical protein
MRGMMTMLLVHNRELLRKCELSTASGCVRAVLLRMLPVRGAVMLVVLPRASGALLPSTTTASSSGQ